MPSVDGQVRYASLDFRLRISKFTIRVCGRWQCLDPVTWAVPEIAVISEWILQEKLIIASVGVQHQLFVDRRTVARVKKVVFDLGIKLCSISVVGKDPNLIAD